MRARALRAGACGRALTTPRPFRCSQGAGGAFTHFYPGTMHAVDLECPVGTPVLAVGDGVVAEVKHDSHSSGIHVANLFEWNSIMVQ